MRYIVLLLVLLVGAGFVFINWPEVGYSSWQLLMEPPEQDRNPMRNHIHFDFLMYLTRN